MNSFECLFGIMPDGRSVSTFGISNDNGVKAEFISYGATITKLFVPDREGRLDDIVLGQDDLEHYLSCKLFSGSVIGRHANRIADAKVELDGRVWNLEKNQGQHNLHSGSGCYANKIFQGNAYVKDGKASVIFYYRDTGEGGFAGEVDIIVTYTLDNENILSIDYRAIPSEKTPINLTNHCYFNLSGHSGGNIEQHRVQINARYYTPNNPDGTTTGEILNVADSPFDLCTPRCIGDGLKSNHYQIESMGGYDHNFCILGRGMRLAAYVEDMSCGRRMSIYTDAPGLQFYTANNVMPGFISKDHTEYHKHNAYCFETQNFPGAVGYSQFPSCIYDSMNVFKSSTKYAFGVC